MPLASAAPWPLLLVAATPQDLEARAAFLEESKAEYDDPGPIFDCVVWRGKSGGVHPEGAGDETGKGAEEEEERWWAAIDTAEDGDLSGVVPMTDFDKVRKAFFRGLRVPLERQDPFGVQGRDTFAGAIASMETFRTLGLKERKMSARVSHGDWSSVLDLVLPFTSRSMRTLGCATRVWAALLGDWSLVAALGCACLVVQVPLVRVSDARKAFRLSRSWNPPRARSKPHPVYPAGVSAGNRSIRTL